MAYVEPHHPGQVIRRTCLESHGLSVAEGARVLQVTRQALNNIVGGKTGISSEMALRLEKAFGESAEFWLQLQLDYDLHLTRKRSHLISVAPFSTYRPLHQTKLF